MLRSLLLGVAPVQQLLSSFVPAAARLFTAVPASQVQWLHQQQYTAAANQAPGDSKTDTSIEQGAAHLNQAEEQQQRQEDGQLEQHLQQQDMEQQQQQIMRQQRLSGPILPTHIILKEVREWQGEPPSSMQLFKNINEGYAAVFPSRAQFKKHLLHLVKTKLVAARPQTAALKVATEQKSGKSKGGTKLPFVYLPTPAGMREDLTTTGTPLQMAARALADKWTDSKLPGYTQHLKAGRIPVTADNAQLLEADKAMQLFKRQQQQQWEKQQAQHERQQQQRQQQNKPRKQQQQAFNRK